MQASFNKYDNRAVPPKSVNPTCESAPVPFAPQKKADSSLIEPPNAILKYYKKSTAFKNGFIFGGAISLMMFEPTLFPIVAGTAMGITNVIRTRGESVENVENDWNAFKKAALFGAIGGFMLGNGPAGPATGIMITGTVTLIACRIRRLIKKEEKQ